MIFTKEFPKNVKKIIFSFEEKANESKSLIIKNFKVETTDNEIKIIIASKKNISYQEINNIFCKIAHKIDKDIAIDLDSFSKTLVNKSDIAYLAATNFDIYTKQPVSFKKFPKPEIKVYCVSSNISDIDSTKLEIITNAINNARLLQELPPNILYPESFCEQILKMSKNIPNLKVKVLKFADLEKQKAGLLIGVGQASINKPCLLILEYLPQSSNKDIAAYVGKGVTFDTGGYNLKPGAAMRAMKFDLSGAATVANFVIAAAKLKYKDNIVGICPLAENSIAGNAIKSDDVLTSLSGLTVEIVNTDAEGRLILGDAVYYANKNYHPNKIVTAATLTGAIGIALNDDYTGVFTENDDLFNQFQKSSVLAAEPIWRLPLTQVHKERLLASRIADILHCPEGTSGRLAGSSTAAAFMAMFADNIPYIHFDIAYTAVKGHDTATGILIKTFLNSCK